MSISVQVVRVMHACAFPASSSSSRGITLLVNVCMRVPSQLTLNVVGDSYGRMLLWAWC